MPRKKTSFIGRAADSATNARDRTDAGRACRSKPPNMRLIDVRPMTNEQERRFESLLDTLILHWLDRRDLEEKSHGSSEVER